MFVKLFDRLVLAVEGSYLFREYVSTWAAPLDNASFDVVLLIVAVIAAFWSAFGVAMNLRYRKSARQRHAEYEAERREYLKYLREIGPVGGVTFAEWRMLRKDAEEPEHEDVKNIAEETEEEEPESVADARLYEAEPEDGEGFEDEVVAEDGVSAEVIAVVQAEGEKSISEEESAEEKGIEPQVDSMALKNDDAPQEVHDSLLQDETMSDSEDSSDSEITGMAEESTDQDDAFGDLIGNLRQRQRQEARAREIDDAAREAAKQNLKKLRRDMESAIAENKADSVKKDATVQESSDYSGAHKRAIKEREKEQRKLEKMQKRGKKWKPLAASAE
ncbi:MAG: hypothetical protein IJJ64_11205 [Butyrivibrio sp.]|nr:hypothetical protein [Butyrivibrio sp.]MBQ7614080.1 hypothetical protein [Butyrivibrio sp.]